MVRVSILIWLVALMLAADAATADTFTEPPPRNLTELKQVKLWATHYRVGRVRRGTDAPYGLGTFGYRLVPFRTIAADRRVFKPGSVFFIPGLVGVAIEDDGVRKSHDGYVFFGDVGGRVRGHHIDVFIGTMRKNPAPDIITSNRRRKFEAYVVTDQNLIERLRRQHVRTAK